MAPPRRGLGGSERGRGRGGEGGSVGRMPPEGCLLFLLSFLYYHLFIIIFLLSSFYHHLRRSRANRPGGAGRDGGGVPGESEGGAGAGRGAW